MLVVAVRIVIIVFVNDKSSVCETVKGNIPFSLVFTLLPVIHNIRLSQVSKVELALADLVDEWLFS